MALEKVKLFLVFVQCSNLQLLKGAMKYSNLQTINEALEKELNKYKQVIEQYNMQKNFQQQKHQQIQTFIHHQQQYHTNSSSSSNSLQTQPVKEVKEMKVVNSQTNEQEQQNVKFTRYDG